MLIFVTAVARDLWVTKLHIGDSFITGKNTTLLIKEVFLLQRLTEDILKRVEKETTENFSRSVLINEVT